MRIIIGINVQEESMLMLLVLKTTNRIKSYLIDLSNIGMDLHMQIRTNDKYGIVIVCPTTYDW